MEKMRIPKIIHYCWFGGGEMSEQERRCIASWKACCPDYTIQCWNETNFDITDCNYAQEAAKAQKWSFVTDYVRLRVLYEYGGFYFDTDVEMLKNLDPLRENAFFIGFEQDDRVNDGQGMGAIPKHPVLKEMAEVYQKTAFYNEDGSMNLKESPRYRTEILRKHGLALNGKRQSLGDIEVYPTDYFCPKNFQTGKITITKNTMSIHHFRGSWHTKKELRYLKRARLMRRLLGDKAGGVCVKMLYAFNDFLKGRKQER